MSKVLNTYYNFQNDMPEPITTPNKVYHKLQEGIIVNTKKFQDATKTLINKDLNKLDLLSSKSINYMLIFGGIGLLYALAQKKSIVLYSSIGILTGIVSYNIVNNIKINNKENGK